ncbi:MAG: hypothetical protein GXO78_08205 [Calditrichaeota bacterium]|nr:hypothetical protein [Calditrichota bacterium]
MKKLMVIILGICLGAFWLPSTTQGQVIWSSAGYTKIFTTINDLQYDNYYVAYPLGERAIGLSPKGVMDFSAFGGALLTYRQKRGTLKNDPQRTGYTYSGFARVTFDFGVYKGALLGFGMEIFGVDVNPGFSFSHSLFSISLGYQRWFLKNRIYWSPIMRYGAVTTGDNKYPTKGRGIKIENKLFVFLTKRILVTFDVNYFPRTAYFDNGTLYRITTLEYRISLSFVLKTKPWI